VPVGVVRADRDQRHGRATGREEAGIDVGAAVVRHLEHIGGQVGAVGHDPGLRLRTQVAGEQHPDPALGHPDHQAEVVRLGPGDRPPGVGGEHLDVRAADLAPLARNEHDVRSPGTGHHLLQVRHPLVGGCQRSGGHLAHLPAGERSGQSGHVVGVQVRQQDEREPPHPEPVQAAVDESAVRSGVHQHRLSGPGREHERVALPDVTGDHHRVGHGPAAAHLAQRPAQGDDPHHRGERQRPQSRPPDERPPRAHQQAGEEHRTACARRPARGAVEHGGGPLGHTDQPAHRPAGAPGEDVGGPWGHRGRQRRQQAQHRGRRHGGSGQQVRRQRDHADHPGQRGHQRRGDDPRGRAHRQGVGEQPRHAPVAQRTRPRRRQQHDRRRGGDREREAGVGRHRGLDQQEDDDGGRQRRHRRPGAARGQRQQRDRAHGRRPQHAGPGTSQDHETEDGDDGDRGLHAAVGAPCPQRPEHQGHDDRHVGPGDGGQVRQTGATELGGQRRVHGGGVTDHQPGQQSRRPGGKHAGGRRGESGAQCPGSALHRARPAGGHRRRACRQHRQDVVPGFGGADSHPEAHLLPRQQTCPLVRRTEYQHRTPADPAARHLDDPRPHQHPRSAGTGQHPRVVVQLEHDRHHCSFGSQRGQR
jgi:hypothetical protein